MRIRMKCLYFVVSSHISTALLESGDTLLHEHTVHSVAIIGTTKY
jgi:hypothetical protein